MGPGQVGDDHGQGGLAGAGRAPQDDGGEQAVGLDSAAQQLAGAEDILLPDELVQGAEAHAGGEGGFGAHAGFVGVGEEVYGPLYNAMVILNPGFAVKGCWIYNDFGTIIQINVDLPIIVIQPMCANKWRQ